ncbi:potassium channel subfamily K member 16-like [Gracilinanus agilis]|uniref:potassium channel subfamily K member 16-like n=1 Tax=Gracilinanus agilis TaxID=191870 RepID=UPI001CFD712F|nr:potassium channel subfamily K member 16-like [Gracilinanus agilis]
MGDLKIQTGLLMMACYFIYLILGSLIFQALETDFERNMITSVYETKAAFLRKLNNLTSEDVESFVKNLTHAVRNGIYPLGNASDHHTNWDFSNSLFFVGSIVSTIGYGILSPKTAGGQLFCVIFALFGIPLNIIFLQHVGKTLSLLSAKLGKCLKRREMNEKKTRFLTLLIFLMSGIIIFFGLPPFVFCSTEGWTYNEGLYFTFITLSTVGFGDYVVGVQPGRKYFPYYRTLVAIWIFFGLVWIALLFNLLVRFLEHTEKKIVQDIHKIRKVGRDSRILTKRHERSPIDTEEDPQKFICVSAEQVNEEKERNQSLCEPIL